jgi:hypothetical protein
MGVGSVLVKVGRVGWLAKGFVYLMAGYLALRVAVAASGWASTPTLGGASRADTAGAIQSVAGADGVVLWLLAAGMLLYAGWRLMAAVVPGGRGLTAITRRAGFVISAVVYLAFASSAVAVARHRAATRSGDARFTDLSASMMSYVAGRVLIGVVAVVVLAAAVGQVVRGIRKDVVAELDLSGLPASRVRWAVRLGSIGELGRGVGVGLVGFFLLRSAIAYDVRHDPGLDSALRRIATQPWGVVVVVVVAVGFAAYGAFCLATFTRRRFRTP